MKKVNSDKTIATNASELADLLGLSQNEGAEMEFRANLNIAIVKKFKESSYTHEQLAKHAKVSRTRLTALLNYNSKGLSTDFMIRVLSALGYKADIKLTKIA